MRSCAARVPGQCGRHTERENTDHPPYLRHRELEAQLGRDEHKVGLLAAPRREELLGVLDDDVHRVHVLLAEAKGVDVVPERLAERVLHVVLVAHLVRVRRREDERHVHVEVVGVLDRADNLEDLVLEIFTALLRLHKVVLPVFCYCGGMSGWLMGLKNIKNNNWGKLTW